MRLRATSACLSALLLAAGLLVSGCSDPGVPPQAATGAQSDDTGADGDPAGEDDGDGGDDSPAPTQPPLRTVGGTKIGGSVRLAAPASLRGVLPGVVAAFERDRPGVKVDVVYLPTDGLVAALVSRRVKADIVVAGSSADTGALYAAKLIGEPSIMVRSTMTLVVPAANPKKITKVADLNRPGVRIAMCAAAAGCGIAGAELAGKAKVAVRSPLRAPGSAGVIDLVAKGRADVGIVGAIDARGAAKVKAVDVGPDLKNVLITFLVAPVVTTSNGGTVNVLRGFLTSSLPAVNAYRAVGMLAS